MDPPRVINPIITFGTWKGGDRYLFVLKEIICRDGNPFVVAAFTNRTFVDQKQFTISYYVGNSFF
jgi:phosphoenolpyruvate carboxylase